ncbi:hypothetical protein [Lacticaseibacillus paracasei]|uniref:Uncharacterized protein n=1 Tax=Lacticaseibacillus paracasei TaxID=1597 RepID=A0AAP4JKY9_LACPA|nr:hypothetical protein [Lacticaseibacillus paracasei]MDM7455469.1 hypothetical protein [Lacticaseibacillus paracasei]MDM7472158.1 hypothetical protein [Lacticaseibacillus paracasei]
MGFLTDWAPIFASAVAAGASIYTGRYTGRKLNEFQKEQLAQQKEIEKAKISAELKAKSRIEWIKGTKKLAIAYILACTKLYEVLNTLSVDIENPSESQQLVDLSYGVFKAGNSLIIQFGTNSKVEAIKEKKFEWVRKKLLNMTTTESMNEYMVVFILAVADEAEKFAFNMSEDLRDPTITGDFLNSKEQFEVLSLDYVTDFRDIIRHYLKIEWNTAKNGQ